MRIAPARGPKNMSFALLIASLTDLNFFPYYFKRPAVFGTKKLMSNEILFILLPLCIYLFLHRARTESNIMKRYSENCEAIRNRKRMRWHKGHMVEWLMLVTKRKWSNVSRLAILGTRHCVFDLAYFLTACLLLCHCLRLFAIGCFLKINNY